MVAPLSRRGVLALGLVFALVGCKQNSSSDNSRKEASAEGDAAAPAVEPADLVLQNGKVVTVDEQKPVAEAIAVRDEKIVEIGLVSEIAPYVGDDTKVIDLDGKLAIPGFIEGHGHFLSLGDSKLQLELGKADTWEEIVQMVKKAADEAEPGEWIRGRGWHQEKWDHPPKRSRGGLPLHKSLSAVSPENPVVLVHASGHAAFVNAEAMKRAGIDRNTTPPPGGEILEDGHGNPTGMLRETATGLVSKAVQKDAAERPELGRKRAELAQQECLSKGITSFQDAGSSFEDIELFKKMADADALDLRLWVMVREPNADLEQKLEDYKIIGYGDNHLTVRAIKRAIDGALGSHGAWLLKPYSDLRSSTGLNTIPLEDLTKTAELAKAHGFQLCVHAIGDRGNRETLDVFEQVLGPKAGESDHRWRVEHAQHLHPDDIPRFAELGVIASMQAVHCTSDGPWVEPRLGEKRAEEGAYVWRKLKDAGAVVTNGTDAPVEDVSPLASYYAMVSRKLEDGSRFYPDQRLSREGALRTYTLDAAYSAHEDDIKGSLTPGKLADITVLSADITTIPEDEILETDVIYTIVGGDIVYRQQERG